MKYLFTILAAALLLFVTLATRAAITVTPGGGGGTGVITTNEFDASAIVSGTISDARLPATISSDVTGNAATATTATNILNGLSTTNLTASWWQLNTNQFALTNAGSPNVNGTYYWSSSLGAWTNGTTGVDYQFYPDIYITNVAADYLYVCGPGTPGTYFPRIWAVSTGVGPAPSGGGFALSTNSETQKVVTNAYASFPNPIEVHSIIALGSNFMARGYDQNRAGTIYNHDDAGYGNAILASQLVKEWGARNFTAASLEVTNYGQGIGVIASGYILITNSLANYVAMVVEGGIAAPTDGFAAAIVGGSIVDYGDTHYGSFVTGDLLIWTNTYQTAIIGSFDSAKVNTFRSLVGGSGHTNWLDSRLFSWGSDIKSSNTFQSVMLGTGLRLNNTTNAFLLGQGLSSTSNNVAKFGFTGAHLNINSNAAEFVGGIPITGNLAGGTNLTGHTGIVSLSISNGQIANSTINSNKLDAATLALLGAGGGSSDFNTNSFTGTGALVRSNSPTLNNPNFTGTATGDVFQVTGSITSLTQSNGYGYFTSAGLFVSTNNGAGWTNLNATELSTGTIPDARYGAPTFNSINLTNLPLSGLRTNGAASGDFITLFNGAWAASSFLPSITTSNFYTGFTNSGVATDSTGKLVAAPIGLTRYKQYGEYFEDFMGYWPSATPFGVLGFIRDVAGTGATAGAPAPTTEPGGIWSLSTGTTTTGQGAFYNTAIGDGLYYLSGQWTNEFRWRITTALGTNDVAGTNNYFLVSGLTDTLLAVPSSGIVMWYSGLSNNVGFVTGNTGTRTTNYTTFAPAINQWVTTRIVGNFDGTPTATCTINETNSVTFTNNIPAAKAVFLHFGVKKTSGTDARVFELDYEYLSFKIPTSR